MLIQRVHRQHIVGPERVDARASASCGVLGCAPGCDTTGGLHLESVAAMNRCFDYFNAVYPLPVWEEAYERAMHA